MDITPWSQRKMSETFPDLVQTTEDATLHTLKVNGANNHLLISWIVPLVAHPIYRQTTSSISMLCKVAFELFSDNDGDGRAQAISASAPPPPPRI